MTLFTVSECCHARVIAVPKKEPEGQEPRIFYISCSKCRKPCKTTKVKLENINNNPTT